MDLIVLFINYTTFWLAASLMTPALNNHLLMQLIEDFKLVNKKIAEIVEKKMQLYL